ncbi:MAG: FAD-dependent oxidoreductase [Clostridia bacterium]|nr:FAD-dependent oxidoreductase [Clostridia bacterium]
MDKQYEPLFTPWKIGNCEIKNRIVMPPMEGTNIIKWEMNTCFNKDVVEFYRERSEAGVGLFICGLVPVVSMVGPKWIYDHPNVFKPVKPLMDMVHKNGSKFFVQLTAGPGRETPFPGMLHPFMNHKSLELLTKPILHLDWWNVGPDKGTPTFWAPEKLKTKELTKERIDQLVYAIGRTSKMLQEQGVDGIEIHAVHEGYLLDQFALKYTNHRTDEYGGSLENRLRFACDIVKEIKKQCGQDFPVSVRYSVESKTRGFNEGVLPEETDYVEAGRDFEESKKAIKILEEAGYDMFNCDNGTYDAWYWAHPPVYAPLNINLEYVEKIKPYTTKPVVCAGRMQPEAGAASIAAGKIDAMAVGRQILCDGQYVKKIMEDRMDEIRPCISCHAACLPWGWTNGNGCDIDPLDVHPGRCALNPRTFREKKYEPKKALIKKKIAVIGGGIGGMEFAMRAAERGHKVDLYEKTDRLGGVFIAAAAPDFKEKDKELLKFYERELEKSPVTVHMNTEITDIKSLKADEIVIATGAKPRTIKVPGGEKAVTATDYLFRKAEVGDKVVIIGGGLTGCEIALELAKLGKHPIIVEQMEYLIKAKYVNAANTNMLRDYIKYYNMPVYLESSVDEIKDGCVVIKDKKGKKQEVACDSVITSIGYIPGTPLAEKESKHVHIIGDANTVGNLKTVILAANDLAIKI